MVKNHTVSTACSAVYRFFVGLRFNLIQSEKYKMESAVEFNSLFDGFFDAIEKDEILIADKSVESLQWRFSEEFFGSRKIGTFWKDDKCIGFCVYKYGFQETACCVYEFLCLRKTDIKYCLKLLVEKMLREIFLPFV